MNSTMHALALRRAGSLPARSNWGSPRPNRPREPARRTSRLPIGAAAKNPGQAVVGIAAPKARGDLSYYKVQLMRRVAAFVGFSFLNPRFIASTRIKAGLNKCRQ